jgi:hypothetical protein
MFLDNICVYFHCGKPIAVLRGRDDANIRHAKIMSKPHYIVYCAHVGLGQNHASGHIGLSGKSPYIVGYGLEYAPHSPRHLGGVPGATGIKGYGEIVHPTSQ